MNDIKKALRSQLRKEYQQISIEEQKDIDARLIQRLIGHDLYRNSDRIFVYASCGTEINTCELIDLAFSQGKTVALPKCLSSGVMNFYRFTGDLTEGKYHIPEPIGDEVVSPERNDLMIVPGLAFDVNGYRIGQGGGYYDRFLAKHKCVCVGLCRERFLQKGIPTMWNDIPVDFVITENAVYECKNKRSFR